MEQKQQAPEDVETRPQARIPGLEIVPPSTYVQGQIDCSRRRTRKSWCKTHKLAPDECESFQEESKDASVELSKVLILCNPFSGNGSGQIAYDDTKSIFEKAKIETHVIYSEHHQHFQEIVQETDLTKYDAVIVIGGDGSFYEVQNAIVAKHRNFEGVPPLGLIPGGTGNSLLTSIGAKSHKDVAGKITRGLVRWIDVGKCTYGADNQVIYWTNALWWGLGVDAAVAAEGMRWLGKFRYDVGGLIHILKGKNYACKMKIDDVAIEGDFQLVMIQNNQHAGSGLRCAPFAKIDDGLLDLVYSENKGRAVLLQAFDQLKKGGSHIYLPQVKYCRIQKLEFESDMADTIVVDGEVIKKGMPLVVEVMPSFLPFLSPV